LTTCDSERSTAVRWGIFGYRHSPRIAVPFTPESNMKNLSETISTEQLIEDFYVVVADAEALLKATADQGGEKIAKLRAKAEASLSTVKERMADAQTAVVSKTRAAGLATEVYVHENPWNAIGVGAGIGLLLGWIMGRR